MAPSLVAEEAVGPPARTGFDLRAPLEVKCAATARQFLRQILVAVGQVVGAARMLFSPASDFRLEARLRRGEGDCSHRVGWMAAVVEGLAVVAAGVLKQR